MGKAMLTLYQFVISHYCEKIRWALDFKKLEYRVKNLLPGPHVITARKLAGDSAVPILVHDGKVVQNSSDIITYLDVTFPQHALTPVQEDRRREALEWEDYLDKEVGIHIRRYFYHTMLEHPAALIPCFTRDGAWYGNAMYRIIFPRLRKIMRQAMNINEQSAQLSRKRVERAIDKLNTRLQGRSYLVGDSFSRADLTAAALLAPLCRPEQYGLDWPARYPDVLEGMVAANLDRISWVREFYSKHR